MHVEFEYICKNKKKNVTEWFNNHESAIIHLYNYNNIFDDISKGDKKYLKCTITEDNEFSNKTITICEDEPIILYYPFRKTDYNNIKVNIVYFATLFCGLERITIIKTQLQRLFKTNLLQTLPLSKLYIVITIAAYSINIENEIFNIFPKEWRDDKVCIFFHFENSYEYEGIKKIYELGEKNDDDTLLLYFHSKGISKNDSNEYLHIFNSVIMEWKWNLFLFQHILNINKIGCICSDNGWIWYNFWWVRSSYIKKLEIPVKTTRRHYYEDWLSRQLRYYKHKKTDNKEITINSRYYNTTYTDCYNLQILNNNFHNIGSNYHP